MLNEKTHSTACSLSFFCGALPALKFYKPFFFFRLSILNFFLQFYLFEPTVKKKTRSKRPEIVLEEQLLWWNDRKQTDAKYQDGECFKQWTVIVQDDKLCLAYRIPHDKPIIFSLEYKNSLQFLPRTSNILTWNKI